MQFANLVMELLKQGKESGTKPGAELLGAVIRSSRHLLQLWNQLFMCDAVLYRRYESPDGSFAVTQVIVLQTLCEEVLRNLHDGGLGGHFGIDKTLTRLKEHFYWLGHHNDVRDCCQKCGSCASLKSPAPNARAPLQSVKVGHPLQLVVMDIAGPFPELPAGNAHIVIVADYFTRWLEAYLILNQEAVTVAKKLTDEGFFTSFHLNSYVHVYQGRNFDSEVIAEVCKLLGVKKTRITPYYPQSDGLVERFHHTLLDMLSTAALKHPCDWESHTWRLCLAYNSNVQLTTGYAWMFGCQVLMPTDLMYGSPTLQPVTVLDYVTDLRSNLELAYQHVHERMGHRLERRKELYNQKVYGDPFQPGALVWLHHPAVPHGRSRKLHCP